MTRTLQQVLDTGGPDLSAFASAFQLAAIGTTFQRQRRSLTGLSSSATFKLSSIDASIPGIRPGGIVLPTAGGASATSGPFVAVNAPAQLVPNGTTGLTVGSGNAAIRIIAKDGFTIRYLQFGGATTLTTGPTYLRGAQSLAVYSSGSGYVIDVWTQLATTAGVGTSTPALIKAAIMADANAMRGISSIDFAGGTGASAAFDQIPLTSLYGLFIPFVQAAGASAPRIVIPGMCMVSNDGNLLALPDSATAMTLDYYPTTRMPMDEPYPGSA